MKKQLISIYKKFQKTIGGIVLLLLLPLTTYADLSANNPALDILTRVSLFIKELIIPLLFGIAFLFFLINMVKGFIIGGANEEALTKARRNALYSLFAFVFLISIWSIVGLLLDGLDIENNSTSLCPDYMENCNDIGSGSGTNGSFGSVTFLGSGTTGTGGTSGSGTSGSGGTGSSNIAGLAELIFGTGKDNAVFTNYTGEPRAIYQTPTIAENTTCAAGLDTLLLANRVETTQAAYVLYKDTAGATHWKNITDLSSANHITYDKDVLTALLGSTIENVHIIHTHQRKRTENLGLSMESHGPSSADMKVVCTLNNPDITYAVADWSGVWTYKQHSDTCPYSAVAANILPVIETYATLASIEASTRQSELLDYLNVSITPSQYKDHFASIDTQQFPSLTPEEVLGLSAYYQTYASTTITYNTAVDTFCNTF